MMVVEAEPMVLCTVWIDVYGARLRGAPIGMKALRLEATYMRCVYNQAACTNALPYLSEVMFSCIAFSHSRPCKGHGGRPTRRGLGEGGDLQFCTKLCMYLLLKHIIVRVMAKVDVLRSIM